MDLKEPTMTWQERIVVDPQILVGKPVIRGTRLAVELIVDLMAQQPVVKVQRRTEAGDEPDWQGATSENTGSI